MGDEPVTAPGGTDAGAGTAGSGGTSAGPDEGFRPDPQQDEIAIRLPARSIYVAVVRTAIAGVAARCSFTVEEIEDLRIAIDEACGLLLADVAPDSMLWCHFVAREDSLVAAVSARMVRPRMPDEASFGWLVLNALVGSVRAQIEGDVMTIILSRPRAAAAHSVEDPAAR